MKHLLPILTLALLGAATTASANFYYDYYKNPDHPAEKSTVTLDIGAGIYNPYSDSDYFAYGSVNSETNQIEEDFRVVRQTNWSTSLNSAGANNNFFRIEVGKDDVQLYLTDFVSELNADTTSFNSSTNALFNKDITQYGYRKLDWDAEAGKYVAGELKQFDVFDPEDNTKLSGNVTPIDTVTNENGKEVTRYKYSLGTFDKGAVIEVYMKDSDGGEVFSYSSLDGGEYVPFDTTEYKYIATMQGGFGDGGYVVAPIEIDDMVDSYYFEGTNLTNAGYTPFATDAARNAASAKAMPLSQLIPGGVAEAAVAFGIYATGLGTDVGGGNGGGGNGGGTSSGAPLPGGLQIALIAGLFGLGFWYIRRRKSTVA
jgi:hypothetical protein